MIKHRTITVEGILLQVRDHVTRMESSPSSPVAQSGLYQEVDLERDEPKYQIIASRLIALGFKLSPMAPAIFGGTTAIFYRPMPLDPNEVAARHDEARKTIAMDEAINKGIQVGSGRS